MMDTKLHSLLLGSFSAQGLKKIMGPFDDLEELFLVIFGCIEAGIFVRDQVTRPSGRPCEAK